MDIPRPEEDDTLIALDPLDVVERVLAAENLSFDRTDDGDLAFALTGDWRDFEVWADDGEIVFRHALSLPDGERPSMAQTASMIDAAMEAADRFYPAFDF